MKKREERTMKLYGVIPKFTINGVPADFRLLPPGAQEVIENDIESALQDMPEPDEVDEGFWWQDPSVARQAAMALRAVIPVEGYLADVHQIRPCCCEEEEYPESIGSYHVESISPWNPYLAEE